MNLDKSIQTGLLIRGYKTRKAFCEAKGISASLISRIGKNSPDIKIGSIAKVAEGFGVPVSTFIEWGERQEVSSEIQTTGND